MLFELNYQLFFMSFDSRLFLLTLQFLFISLSIPNPSILRIVITLPFSLAVFLFPYYANPLLQLINSPTKQSFRCCWFFTTLQFDLYTFRVSFLTLCIAFLTDQFNAVFTIVTILLLNSLLLSLSQQLGSIVKLN